LWGENGKNKVVEGVTSFAQYLDLSKFLVIYISIFFIIVGLMPANANNGRPKPFFTYFGFGDIQLEFISWFGLYNCLLFVKYESMVFAAILWASYLSIGKCLRSSTFINIKLYYSW